MVRVAEVVVVFKLVCGEESASGERWDDSGFFLPFASGNGLAKGVDAEYCRRRVLDERN